MPEGRAVQTMFGEISGRYDLANRVLSSGFDVYWRRVLVGQVARQQPREVLDLATGSGDVAFALRRKLGPQIPVTGMDFCQPMLEEAERKKPRHPGSDDIRFLPGDILHLPLPDAGFDAITIAFGLRNLESRAQGLAEMRRVLRPGGWLYVLEFTQPDAWMRPFYYLYLKHLLPGLARLFTGNRQAYEYLAGSIEQFPDKESLAEEFRAAGFGTVNINGLTGSIVALHAAQKPL